MTVIVATMQPQATAFSEYYPVCIIGGSVNCWSCRRVQTFRETQTKEEHNLLAKDAVLERAAEARALRKMFESINELRKVRAKRLSLALIGKWKIIDANKSTKEVGTEIRKKLALGDTGRALVR